MILDAFALLSDAVSTTTSVASTDYIDTLATGQSYEGCFFVARVDTSFVAGAGAPTVTFQLQTSDASDFSGATTATMCQSAAYLAAALTAGKRFAVRIPTNAKRYIRGYAVVDDGGNTKRFSTSVYDMFIVKDVSVQGLGTPRYEL